MVVIFAVIPVAIEYAILDNSLNKIDYKLKDSAMFISKHPYANVKKEKTVTVEEDFILKASEFVLENDSHGAINALSEGIAKQPNNCDLYSMRGVHHHLVGKNEESLKDHQKAIELTTDKLRLASMYTNKAITEIALKQPANAEHDFKKALEFKQPYYITHLEYGKFLLDQGKRDLAIEYLTTAKNKLAEVGPENFYAEADALLKKMKEAKP